jgi:flagellar biosynthesis protein FlhG
MVAVLTGNHYEVLGIDARAAPEQVEKAYRFCLEMYGDSSVALYSLLDPEEQRRARARVQEAYEVLRDPFRRHEYDVSQGFARPGGPMPVLPRPASGPVPVRTPPPPPPRLPAPQVLEGPVDGAALRRFREQRGISLKDIAARTKIGVRYLEYIEADRHAQLPAAVYLRGFLLEYARVTGLEPRRTAEGYMARVRRPTSD